MDLTFSSLSVRPLENGIWAAPGGASGVLEAPFWAPSGGLGSCGSSFLGVPILDHILGSIGNGGGTTPPTAGDELTGQCWAAQDSSKSLLGQLWSQLGRIA